MSKAFNDPTQDNVEYPPTATVVIGINEITKEEYGHSDESKEEYAAGT